MKVIAVVGSYRKGGTIDTVIDEILASAREEGAEVAKIYLIDKHIELCRNCRTCTQGKGSRRGECLIVDEMSGILDEIEQSDAIVLGSPLNFGTVTAVMKIFMERLVGFAYWPWGAAVPKVRNSEKGKKAVIVVSSAAPSLLVRLQTDIIGLLKKTAGLLGARPIGVVAVGLAARKQKQEIPQRARRKARLLGKRLAS